jgi:hypothetical protein
MWTGFDWLRICSSSGNEPRGSIKGRKCLDQLNYYQFLMLGCRRE